MSLGKPPARTEILRGINLHVTAGESVALLGPSGSGKSSLMALLSGMERPSHGSVRVAGLNLEDLTENQLAIARRGRIAIILQAFHLLPTMRALENVAVPLELAGEAQAFVRAEAELRAVSSSAAPSPARWHRGPPFCSPTNQPATSIARPATRSWI